MRSFIKYRYKDNIDFVRKISVEVREKKYKNKVDVVISTVKIVGNVSNDDRLTFYRKVIEDIFKSNLTFNDITISVDELFLEKEKLKEFLEKLYKKYSGYFEGRRLRIKVLPTRL